MAIIALGVIEVISIALAYAGFSAFLQRKYMYNAEMRVMRSDMMRKQKEFNDIVKANPNAPELQPKQKELMDMMSKTMKASMKPMLFSLPVFFLLYYLALPSVFATSNILISVLSFNLDYKALFIVVAIVSGLLSTAFFSLYDKVKARSSPKI